MRITLGGFFKILMLRPHPRPIAAGCLGWDPTHWCFSKLPRWPQCTAKDRTPALRGGGHQSELFGLVFPQVTALSVSSSSLWAAVIELSPWAFWPVSICQQLGHSSDRAQRTGSAAAGEPAFHWIRKLKHRKLKCQREVYPSFTHLPNTYKLTVNITCLSFKKNLDDFLFVTCLRATTHKLWNTHSHTYSRNRHCKLFLKTLPPCVFQDFMGGKEDRNVGSSGLDWIQRR